MRRLLLIGIMLLGLWWSGCRDVKITTRLTGDDLLFAAWNGDAATVTAALEQKIDVNTRDQHQATALLYAAHRGLLDILTMLLDHHADVNAKDVAGITALMEASRNGHLAVVEQLLAAQADVKARDQNLNTALIFAAVGPMKVEEIVKVLMEHGADVNAQNHVGISPLMGAARLGNTAVVRLLLFHGADWNATTSQGKTALSLAVEYGHPQTINILQAFGQAFRRNASSSPVLWDWRNIPLPTPERRDDVSPSSPTP